MQRLEDSGAVRPIHGSLGVKRLIYDHTRTTYESILTYTNSIDKNLQLISNPETDDQVNLLDLLISRKPKALK